MIKRYITLQPMAKEFIIKISILKTMMYCGVLWGLYHAAHQGWAIRMDDDEYIFPFWLGSLQALEYAKIHWPQYTPKKITPKDFEESLLPTLNRLNVQPALFNHKGRRFKLSKDLMQIFFFNSPQQPQFS